MDGRGGRHRLGRFRDNPMSPGTLLELGFHKLKDGRWVLLERPQSKGDISALEVDYKGMERQVAHWRAMEREQKKLMPMFVVLVALLGGWFLLVLLTPAFEGAAGRDMAPFPAIWFAEKGGAGVFLVLGIVLSPWLAPYLITAATMRRVPLDNRWKATARRVDISDHVEWVDNSGLGDVVGLGLLGVLFMVPGVGWILSTRTDLLPLWVQAEWFGPEPIIGELMLGLGAVFLLAQAIKIFQKLRKSKHLFEPVVDLEGLCAESFLAELVSEAGAASRKPRFPRFRQIAPMVLSFSVFVLFLMAESRATSLSSDREMETAEPGVTLILDNAPETAAPDPGRVLAAFEALVIRQERVAKWRTPVRVSIVRADGEDHEVLDGIAEYLWSLQRATGLTFDLAPVDSEDAAVIVRLIEAVNEVEGVFARMNLEPGNGRIDAATLALHLPLLRGIAVRRAEIERPGTRGAENRDWERVNEHLSLLSRTMVCRGLLAVLGVPGRLPREAILLRPLPEDPCVLSPLDAAVLRLLYAPRITPGMDPRETLAVAREIAAEGR